MSFLNLKKEAEVTDRSFKKIRRSEIDNTFAKEKGSDDRSKNGIRNHRNEKQNIEAHKHNRPPIVVFLIMIFYSHILLIF